MLCGSCSLLTAASSGAFSALQSGIVEALPAGDGRIVARTGERFIFTVACALWRLRRPVRWCSTPAGAYNPPVATLPAFAAAS